MAMLQEQLLLFTESTSETFTETQSPNKDSTHGAKRGVFERRHFR